MTKYTLRQYRSAVKQFFKTIDEFVSYKGRTYSTKYYEVKQKIEIFENAIQRRTYTNSDLANMMRILKPKTKGWVTDYVVQYDPEKDKFVKTYQAGMGRLPKREGEVPSIGEVKREAIEEYNKQFEEDEEDEDEEDDVGNYGDDFGYDGDEEDDDIPDWYSELYYNLLDWAMRRMPWEPAEDLYNSLIKLYGRKDLIRKFEEKAYDIGIDIEKIESEDAHELAHQANLIWIEDILGDKYDSNNSYDNTDFGEY